MIPAPAGTLILVKRRSNSHNYTIGRVYRVLQSHPDGTFIAVDSQGDEGGWLKWIDCEPVGTGWEWLRGQLDARSLDILSAFDGVESLRLREAVETAVIISIPNLQDAIIDVLTALEAARQKAAEENSADEFDLSAIP